MRVDTVIAALRPFLRWRGAGKGVSAVELARAYALIREFDALPKEPELTATEPVVCTFGAKDGMVVFQTKGNELVEPMFLVWSIDDANEVIDGIQKAIVLAEEQQEKNK